MSSISPRNDQTVKRIREDILILKEDLMKTCKWSLKTFGDDENLGALVSFESNGMGCLNKCETALINFIAFNHNNHNPHKKLLTIVTSWKTQQRVKKIQISDEYDNNKFRGFYEAFLDDLDSFYQKSYALEKSSVTLGTWVDLLNIHTSLWVNYCGANDGPFLEELQGIQGHINEILLEGYHFYSENNDDDDYNPKYNLNDDDDDDDEDDNKNDDNYKIKEQKIIQTQWDDDDEDEEDEEDDKNDDNYKIKEQKIIQTQWDDDDDEDTVDID